MICYWRLYNCFLGSQPYCLRNLWRLKIWLANCVKVKYTRVLIRQIIHHSPNSSQLLGFRQKVFETLSDFMQRFLST